MKKIGIFLLNCLLLPAFIEGQPTKAVSNVFTGEQQAVCAWQFTGDTESIAVVSGVTGASAFRNGNEITTQYTHAGNFECSDQTLNTVHSWTQPATQLIPGQQISFDVSASWDLIGSASCTSLTTGLHTYIMAGLTTIKADRSKIVVSKEPSGSVSNTGSWVVPTGSKEGELLTINANANTGIGGGSVTYNYTYVCQQPTIEATLTSVPTQKSFECKGTVRDSGARFADFSGEVTVAPCSDPENLTLAEMDMVIETGSIIKTESDSMAIISFADMTTFVMKPFTTVVIDFPEEESKLSLLAGKIWANVKYMAETGHMNVTTNQAMSGTKGTTFVLEETGQLSTLKVLDGEMFFRSHATGKSLDVTTGQSISADPSGLTEVVTFDVSQEAAQWPETAEIGAQNPSPTTSPTTNGPIDKKGLLTFLVLSVCLLVVLGLAVFGMRYFRKRR